MEIQGNEKYWTLVESSFLSLIKNSENAFLVEEAGCPLEQLVLKYELIESVEDHVDSWWKLKIICGVHFEGKKVGRYLVWLDREEKVCDDSLIF